MTSLPTSGDDLPVSPPRAGSACERGQFSALLDRAVAQLPAQPAQPVPAPRREPEAEPRAPEIGDGQSSQADPSAALAALSLVLASAGPPTAERLAATPTPAQVGAPVTPVGQVAIAPAGTTPPTAGTPTTDRPAGDTPATGSPRGRPDALPAGAPPDPGPRLAPEPTGQAEPAGSRAPVRPPVSPSPIGAESALPGSVRIVAAEAAGSPASFDRQPAEGGSSGQPGQAALGHAGAFVAGGEQLSVSAVAQRLATSPADGTLPGNLTPRSADGDPVAQLVVRAHLIAGSGGKGLRLQLRPPELGGIDVRLAVDSGQVALRITAETARAKELIEAGWPRLQEGLRDHGLRADRPAAVAAPEERVGLIDYRV